MKKNWFKRKQKSEDIFGEVTENSPFIYLNSKEGRESINPIYNLDTCPNTPERFIILRTTSNGKYVIGNMIHYNYNGLEIVTDINNAIFVDTINNTIFIREYDKVLREIAPEDPETRQYIILFTPFDKDQDEVTYEWIAIEGRTATYDWIKHRAWLIDSRESLVLTENVPYKDALTVSDFVQYLHNSGIVDDDFDIHEFEERYQ